MHLADGLINTPVAATGYVVAGTACFGIVRGLGRQLEDQQAPLLGMTGAFIFAAQMLNFPVGPGVSGHFLGALFATLLVGPARAFLIMTLVVTMQCLLFADGGLSALGVNTLNMGLVACFAGYGAFRFSAAFLPKNRTGFLTAAAFGAWCSVVAGGVACGTAMALSERLPWFAVAPLTGIQAVIGLGEAGITVGALAVVLNARPDLVTAWNQETQSARPVRKRTAFLGAGTAALLCLVLLAPFASSAPDGLEHVAHNHAAPADTPPQWAPLADYAWPGQEGAYWGAFLPGLIGCVAMLAAVAIFTWCWKCGSNDGSAQEPRT